MAKPLRKPNTEVAKRPRDVNQLAHFLVQATTGQAEEKPAAAVTQADVRRVMTELGRRGGKKGGIARAKTLTEEQRREIALKAARARWDKDSSL